jgi:hypothetical protein
MRCGKTQSSVVNQSGDDPIAPSAKPIASAAAEMRSAYHFSIGASAAFRTLVGGFTPLLS